MKRRKQCVLAKWQYLANAAIAPTRIGIALKGVCFGLQEISLDVSQYTQKSKELVQVMGIGACKDLGDGS